MATQVWEYVVDTYYTAWGDLEDRDVELNRIAGDYSGVWRDSNVEVHCCFYRRHVSFGFSHEDVARMFVSRLPKDRFGVSGVSIGLSDGGIYKLDMADFMSKRE